MSSPILESALVRLLIDIDNDQESRQPVGAGFLVTPQHIITCTHVVNEALGHSQDSPDRPDVEVLLDFPLVTEQPLFRARVLHCAVREESAVGELELVSKTPRPAPLVLPHEQSFLISWSGCAVFRWVLITEPTPTAGDSSSGQRVS